MLELHFDISYFCISFESNNLLNFIFKHENFPGK